MRQTRKTGMSRRMMDGLRRAVGRVLDGVSTAELSRYLDQEAGGGRPDAGGKKRLTHHGVGEGDALLPHNRREAGGGRPEDLTELTRRLREEARKAGQRKDLTKLTLRLREEARKAGQREHERRERRFLAELMREVARSGEGRVQYVPRRWDLPIPGAALLLKGGADFEVGGSQWRALVAHQSSPEVLVISIYQLRKV